MKKILIFVLFATLFSSLPVCAQKKKADKAAAKELSVELAELEKNGWQLFNPNGLTLHEQVANMHALKKEQFVNENNEQASRYLFSFASHEDRSLDKAFQFAKTKAKTNIATSLKTVVDVTTTANTYTTSLDNDNHNSTGTSINKRTDTQLNSVEEFMRLYRKNDKGLYEVRVYVALDLANHTGKDNEIDS